MRFEATALEGVWVIGTEPVEDERGSFARTFCEEEFRAHGIDPRVAQCSMSTNAARWTLRGLHLQAAPHGETKLVRCLRGAIFDVAVDLRPGSATFGAHHAVTLSGADQRALVMPPGVAHGYLTLEDGCEIWYQMSVPYAPASSIGVRWDDAELAIPWPVTSGLTMSPADVELPLLADLRGALGGG